MSKSMTPLHVARKPLCTAVLGGLVALATPPLGLASGTGVNPCASRRPLLVAAACNPCNPCAAKKKACNPCNPCAAKKKACNPCNPCAAKKACNPCNPCAAKKACNPCNPCAAKKACNPCNPCAAKKACNPCNPCAAKKACNPCNPCAAKKACNPCNPCAAKKACNPCNPCAAKNACNPCNPCGAGKVAARSFRRPVGLKPMQVANAALIAEGKKLWEDTSIGTSGLACGTCHAGGAALNATFAQPYPHKVAMPSQMAGVGAIHLDEMVQFCMVVPMAAKPLGWGSRELAALTAYSGEVQKGYNPCAAKNPCNPCNPCAAKKACNPCNPCAARKACNPCNPCAAKRKSPCNPCNPCAAKKAS